MLEEILFFFLGGGGRLKGSCSEFSNFHYSIFTYLFVPSSFTPTLIARDIEKSLVVIPYKK